MAQNNFILDLIASLKKAQSKKQVQSDANNLGDIKVPLIGTLNKSKTKAQLRQDLASLNGTVNLTGKVNKKSIVTSVQQSIQQTQNVANKNAIQVNLELKKNKLINDIKVFGQQNSKLFTDTEVSSKYNSILNNAKLATSNEEIHNLRLQLSALRSEIKATNLNGLTLGDTFKKTFKRATELFTGTGGVMLLTQQMRQAWTEALNLDKAYTDLIKVQDELSRGDYPEYLEKCNEKAQELAVTQQALIESTTEFSKSGYNLTESNALTEKATILANVGDMSASDSAKAIISGIQAYDVVDGYDDVVSKAEALIDKYNEIGNTASITTAEIAQGVQSVGSVFADANTSVDEFIALLAAGNRQYQDADALALALRTSALRIRGCTAELEEMGEETEGVITSTAKLEEKIKALTDIDGIGGVDGVSILEEDGETFRSIYDIFLDISKVYQQMSDTDQSALLELIAGKYRASAISSTINNMSEAQEIYQRSLDSAGSAQEEYEKYLQSSTASLNRFKSSMTETYQSVINGETVTGILNCGNATLQFVNSLGLVESSLKGLVAIGIVKAITTLSTAFKASAISASDFGTALNTVKNMSTMARGTTEYSNALNTLKIVSAGLSETQLKQVLSSKALSDADRVAILRATGLTKAQTQAKLAQMGLTQSTKAQTTAQKTATASTFSLTAAVKGFAASLRAAFMNNPVGIAIMAISTAFGAVTSAIDSANQKAEETRQKAKEAADEANTLGDEISNLANKYIQLSEAVKTDSDAKEDLMSTQTELLKKLGLEGEGIDTLIEKYGSLSNAINSVSIDSLKNARIDLLAGVNATKEDLLDVARDNFWGTKNIISASGDDAVKAFEELERAGVISSGSYGSNGGSLVLIGDNTVEGALENFHRLEKAVEVLRDSEQFTTTELSNNPLYLSIYSRYSDMKDVVEAYTSSIDNLNENVAQETMLTTLQGKEIPRTEEDFETFRQELIDTAIASEQFIGNEEEITHVINDYLSTVPQFEGFYSIPLENEINKVNTLLAENTQSKTFSDIFSLEGTDSTQTNLGKLSEQIDEVQSAYSTLSSAIKEYYSDGSISIDTMQSIMALGDDWLDYLSLENGALNLDEQALENLTKARIEAMKQQTLSNLISNVSNIQTEADANEYLASTNYDAANSYEALAKEKLADAEASLKQKLESGDISQDTYDKVIEKLENDINKIHEIFYNTNFNFSSDGNVANSIETLENHADILKSVKEEYESVGKISSSTLSSIINAYPELGKYVEQYRLGLISEKELFAELEKCYESDKNAYIQSLTEKSLMDKEFLDTMKTNYPRLFIELQRLYGEDLSGWKSIEQAKLDISADTVSQIAKLYQEFYKAMGVDNGIDFNQQVVRKAIASGNVAAGGSSLFSKMYTSEGLKKVIGDTDATLNGNEINNAYDQLQNNISNVLSQAEAMKGALDKYNTDVFNSVNDRFDFSWDTLADGDSSSTSQTAEKLNWIERLINKISTAYNRLKNVVSNTADTWLNRNNALSDSMQVLLSEIDAQSKAYDYYMNLFNSYGLDDYYKNQIANGSINIEVIYDDNLKEAINECQDLYDKAQDAKDEVQNLNIELSTLSKQKFDDVASQFDDVINKISAFSNQLSKELDIIEEKGWFASKVLNNKLIEQEQKNLNKLESERMALINALNEAVNSGRIEEESEDWYDMQSQIDDVTSAILDSKKALIEYQNAIRQINWDAFDRTRDDVTDLIEETEFLVDLFKDIGTTDDKGNFNDYGKAAQALLAQNYQLYLSQADEYSKEILKINEELANNPFDQNLLDRRQELLEAQQDAIQAAQDEKDAIKDLVSDAYSKYMDSLNELIDKYKELLQTQKDAYDYEKTIREKTEALNALEKQYSAYQGDNSEEGKKNIQELKEQINEAKDDLQETEYDKLISDTEKLLDELSDETQTWLDSRLDNIDTLINDIIEQTNKNSSDISQTIINTADNFGYKLSDSMSSIWKDNTNNITDVLSEYGNKFNEGQTTLNNTVNAIKEFTQKMLANSDAEAARAAEELAKQQAEQSANTDGGYSNNGNSGNSGDSYWNSGGDSGNSSSSNGDIQWIYEKNYYPTDQLNIDTSIVDRLKWNDFASSFEARSQYYSQMGGEGNYYATYDQNVWMLEWMKQNGYANGTKNATKGLHLFDEDGIGSEVILTKHGTLKQFEGGEHVFDSQSVQNLWELAQFDPSRLVPDLNLNYELPKLNNRGTNNDVKIEFGDINVTANNPEEFGKQLNRELAKNQNTIKIIQEQTIGRLVEGHNSLSARRYL